jgi:STE24 endopeptidase
MNEPRATRYQRLRRRAAMAAWCLAGITLAVLAATPAARWLSDAAWRVTGGLPDAARAIAALALFAVSVLVVWEIAALPAVLFLALKVDHAYGRTEGHVEDVLVAQAKATLFALPVVLAGGLIVSASAQLAGRWWWTAAGVLLSAGLVAIQHGVPGVLARLSPARPMSKPELSSRLHALAARVRVPVAGIHEWTADERAMTALVTGVGRGRRVLVSSDIVRTWPDDEIEVVVAHELAHHAHRDLWRTLTLDAAVMAIALLLADRVLAVVGPSLNVAGPADLAALPLIALTALVVWAVLSPIRHAQSRRHERRADAFALSWTGGADAFGAAVRRLSAKHLADERPSTLARWLYHRHPPVAERLALAESYRNKFVRRT